MNSIICRGAFQVKVADLNGKQVITSGAQVLGEVEGVEIDIDKWKVTGLHINLEKEIIEKLDFKKPLFGSVIVRLPITTIKVVGDVVALDKTIEELRYMREFKVEK
jgi:sporulation protein YlmC with PRC-barrel domain